MKFDDKRKRLKTCAPKGENRLTGWDGSAFFKKETVHGNKKHKSC